MEKIKYKRKREAFGKYIKGLRALNALTLRQVSDKTGIPFGMIACIERGEPTKISMEFLHKSAETYGVGIDDLCRKAERIPSDVYYKIAQNSHLWDVIREMEV